MPLFRPKNWRKADVANPKKHECKMLCCLTQISSQRQTLPLGATPPIQAILCLGWTQQGSNVWMNLPSLPTALLSIAQSLLPLFLSSIIKLSLLFWFKSCSELSELKINHSVSGNAEPPGSRKHLFLLSARRGNSGFRIKYGNFDCNFTSPHSANSHFNFQK